MSGKKKKHTKREKRIKKMRQHTISASGHVQSACMNVSNNPALATWDVFGGKVSNRNAPVIFEKGVTEKLYGQKISEALKEFCAPLLEEDEFDMDELRGKMNFAATAWNLTYLSASDRRECLADMLSKFDESGERNSINEECKLITTQTLKLLIERKQKLFPHINCMITSVEVIDEGDDYRLLVAGVPLRESVWIYSIRNLFGGIKSLLQKLFGLKSPNKVAIGEKPPVATMEQIYQEVKELDDLSNSVLDLLEEKRIDEAERVCERLQREYPEVIDGWERLGVVRVAQERWLEASQCYRKVVDLMRKDGDSEKESIAWAVGKAEKFEVMHNTSQPG